MKSEFPIWFKKKATIKLNENENVTPWQPNPYNIQRTMEVNSDSIKLIGEWRLNSIVNIFSGGLLGEIFVKPLFVKNRIEVLKQKDVKKIVVHTKKMESTYHIFQPSGDGIYIVHVFTTNRENASELSQVLKSMFTEKNVHERIE